MTEAIKGVLQEHYNYDSTVCFQEGVYQNGADGVIAVRRFPLQNTFYALYRSFTECCFIEDEGNIVFYKNRHGEASRELAEGVVVDIKKSGWTQEVQDELADGTLSDSVAEPAQI